MHATRIATLTLALLLGAWPVAAQQKAPDDPRAAFAEADRNQDGYVDREEFHLRIVELFFFVDTDKDGFVEPEELEKATLVRQDLSQTDRNGDGRISLHEFVEARFVLFRQADTDADGRLTVEEVVIVYDRSRSKP